MIGPIPYIGGKNRIAKKIIEVFPEHTTYVESFAGGAQVFFHKTPSSVEVLNDIDGEIVNFFRICQAHYEELLRYLKFVHVSRKWFALINGQNPAALTDIQRAARFLYLQKNAFAGLVSNPTYTHSVENPRPFNPTRLPEIIENANRRLARVQLENLPYGDILDRFDKKKTLFYLDPPYFGLKLYRFNFTEEDFKEMRERLGRIKGKFVLSLNDVPDVRELFKDFQIRQIELHYTAQQKAGKKYREVLITNFS
jgi:DNA adenine methylase